MKQLYILLALIACIGSIRAEYCYNNVVSACGAVGGGIESCNANYSGVSKVLVNLQSYTMTHIAESFQYLLMSAHFSNYEVNREGFAKLYRKLSDSAWEDAIDLIKYIGKRGFKMNFGVAPDIKWHKAAESSYKMYELSSLARALDMQKILADAAHKIHGESTKRSDSYHDAETINFIEKEFVGKHAESIRDLSGYANDLHKLIKGGEKDPSLAIYLFDEHLKSVVS